jgi:uncharacterized protein YjiS (DUF1127 family)
LCVAAQLQKTHVSHAFAAIVSDPVHAYLSVHKGPNGFQGTRSRGAADMAKIITNTAAPFGAITIHRIVSAVSGIADNLRAWNETRRTINALRALSPAQLDDIGLTRSEVEDFGHKSR